MKMKLLFVISQFYKGGAETSLLNLLKLLDSAKYEIDLLIMNQAPVKNAVSLVPQLPDHIYVFDAWKKERHLSPLQRIKGRFLLTEREKAEDPVSALLFVRGKEYDCAFHVGEWWFNSFVATKVKARRKAVWIHNDLSHAEYFHADGYFAHDKCFEKYIFVSQNSMAASLKKFPFLKTKSCCIYNINDAPFIRTCAKEPITEKFFESSLPVLLTCANIRQQKNHMRQLQAMHLLKKRGIEFIWLNIGATTETDRCEELLATAENLGLQDHFLLAGPKENPYKYIARADAVTVLSDYESWSMVISEAKILGVPVIATKTSGALEQIKDRETGLLTDFSVLSIANAIEDFLTSQELRDTICRNTQNFDNTKDILKSFDMFVNQELSGETATEKERLLYVIDDINYMGGAHIATKLQIKALLEEGQNVTIFSSSSPTAEIRSELDGVSFLGWPDFKEDQIYNRRLLDCLFDKTLTKEDRRYKLVMTCEGKVFKNSDVFNNMVLPHLSELFSQYDVACVMSEGSVFRKEVAASTCRRKIQWIHIDYCAWRNKTAWNKKITADDGELYRDFDKIVVLSPNIKDSFIQLYPHLAAKVVVNRNMIPAEVIIKRANKKEFVKNTVHFVTVGRLDYQKAYGRLLSVLQELYKNGYRFHWTIIGGGEDYAHLKGCLERSEFSDWVEMTGPLDNPFPLVKEADVFALLSQFEGLPNTIYEALILGVPVIATDTGGVASQIEIGKTGWLVENHEDAIYKGLEHILRYPEEIQTYKENLKIYHYDNKEVLNRAKEILFGAERI